MEFLGFNMRVPREHGPAIREMEGGSPGGTYIYFDQRGCACFRSDTVIPYRGICSEDGNIDCR